MVVWPLVGADHEEHATDWVQLKGRADQKWKRALIKFSRLKWIS